MNALHAKCFRTTRQSSDGNQVAEMCNASDRTCVSVDVENPMKVVAGACSYLAAMPLVSPAKVEVISPSNPSLIQSPSRFV